MFANLLQLGTVSDYLRFYQNLLARRWANLSPMEYGIILIAVMVFGYLLMRNSVRR